MGNKTTSYKKISTIGASLAAVAAVSYFFFGPKGKRNQRQVKAWALKMKAEVIEKLEKTKELGEPTYQAIIDKVAEKYQKQMKSSPEEVKKLASDLKGYWQNLVNSQTKDKVVSAKVVTPKTKKKTKIKTKTKTKKKPVTTNKTKK
jgi:hypothetical protein